jgi:hypothetical protein
MGWKSFGYLTTLSVSEGLNRISVAQALGSRHITFGTTAIMRPLYNVQERNAYVWEWPCQAVHVFKFENLYTHFYVIWYCDMHACLRPLLSNGPSQQVNSEDAC